MKLQHSGESGGLWHVGLLVSTVAMGIALLATGVSGYLQAGKNAETAAAAEMDAMMQGMRREWRRGDGGHESRLSAILAEFDSERASDAEPSTEGITAAAVLSEKGDIVVLGGKIRRPFDTRFLRQSVNDPRKARALRLYENGIVHGVFRLSQRFGRRRGGGVRGAETFIAVEAVSISAQKIRADALFSLSVSAAAAVLLLSTSLLFLRQKNAADLRARALEDERRELAVRLERDERLKALGRMSAVLGHELRNPIAALKGHAQLLVESLPKDHAAAPRAQVVVREAELLETLTGQVLDFVRTGELHLGKVYVDDLLESAAALSGVDTVRVSAPENTPWILDRSRVEQALLNLLRNAAQASPSDEDAPVDLSAEIVGERLRICVRDRGDGIPDENLERIFHPFVTGKAQGTGLGLALVQRVTEAHGGRVFAANRSDGGAVFTMELPAMQKDTEGDGAEAEG